MADDAEYAWLYEFECMFRDFSTPPRSHWPPSTRKAGKPYEADSTLRKKQKSDGEKRRKIYEKLVNRLILLSFYQKFKKYKTFHSIVMFCPKSRSFQVDSSKKSKIQKYK